MLHQMKQKLRRQFYSIRTSMVLFFVLLISVVVLLVSTISYAYSIKDFEHLSVSYTEGLIAEINVAIDSYIDNIKSMSSVICNSQDVQDLMAFYNSYRGAPIPPESIAHLETLRWNAGRHLAMVAGTRAEITNVAVISKYHDVLLGDRSKTVNPDSLFNLTDWFLKPLSMKDQIVVSPTHVQNIVQGEYNWVISISRAVFDPTTGDVTGVMVMDLNFYTIKSICDTVQLGKNGYTYIIDQKQNVIYHPQQQLIYAGIKVDPFAEVLKMQGSVLRTPENKIYTKNTSELTGWTAVGVVNANELIRDRIRIINFYFTLSFLSLVFATIAALLISGTITRPLKKLESTMHLVEEGDLSLQVDTDSNNEVGHLARTFNVMVQKIKALMDSAVANEEAKRKSEINALQAQINPHFLYNTLDTIIWMSASGKTEEVTQVTEALAKLFRTSISRGENYVPLRNEIENIKSYLTIQKMRYGDKLSYELNVDDSFMDYTVPKLILQPIVENALYHGIKVSPQAGVIRIGAVLEPRRFIITISDNGIGMDAEQVAGVLDAKPTTERGIGVTNVNHRIQLCYGEEYGLHYFSVPGTGTRVEIWLPISSEGGEGHE
ncbi:MAG: sensor histidine kinase [Oscillospiraceae bacterium]